jgi:hypothetical protein
MCIKHVCETFCTVIIDFVDHGKKILNLLFDTFHSTKYYHAHLFIIACHFCLGCFTCPNAMKILW